MAITLVSVGASPSRAGAQAPVNADVALQPPKGGLILRQQIRFARADFNRSGANRDRAQWTASTTAVYGVTETLTVLLNAPVVLSRRITERAVRNSDTETGLADWQTLVKLRLWRSDTGPTDTIRFDAVVGLELPVGEGAFTSDSVDPMVGGVLTIARNRHFFDADVLWKFNSGSGVPDVMRYDAAYIHRLWPARYSAPNQPAVNAVFELNGRYETSNENAMFFSPGVQYVTNRWIVEATVQLPLWQDLHRRPETDFVVGVGVRVQF